MLDVLAEDQLKDEVSHPIARQIIRRAAGKTTIDQPFLLFPEVDCWYVLNNIRLAIAEFCRAGAVAKMAPAARVQTIDCVFALTFERYLGIKQGKIRVMIVPKSLLEDPLAFSGDIRFESPSHIDRISTLQKMQKDYLQGKGGGKWKYCMDVRLSIQL